MGPREQLRTPWPADRRPAAFAWLLGYVRTDVPGYRELVPSEGLAILASSTGYRFDALITAAAAAAPGADIAWATDGSVQSDNITCPDRLGWVFGWGTEAGATFSNAVSYFVPPAGIPLMGATWTKVERESDRRQIIDRHRRNQGIMGY